MTVLERLIRDLHPTNLRYLFYLVTPNETTYYRIEDVPQFTERVRFHINKKLLRKQIDIKIFDSVVFFQPNFITLRPLASTAAEIFFDFDVAAQGRLKSRRVQRIGWQKITEPTFF